MNLANCALFAKLYLNLSNIHIIKILDEFTKLFYSFAKFGPANFLSFTVSLIHMELAMAGHSPDYHSVYHTHYMYALL